MSQTIFLSTVSSEFGHLRQRLADLIQKTKKIHIRHQDDFLNRGVKTLHLLEEEIESSDVVIHLLGNALGWMVPTEQVADFLTRHPDFEPRFPDVAREGRSENISATQWEAWLALYFEKRLCAYSVTAGTTIEDLQQLHATRLEAYHLFPKRFDNEEKLFDDIVGSLIVMDILATQDVSLSSQHYISQLFSAFRVTTEPYFAKLTPIDLEELLDVLLCNEHALAYATVRMKQKYQSLVLPAKYEYVAATLHFARQDIRDYLADVTQPSFDSLVVTLYGHVRMRASTWVHSPANEKLFPEVFFDFYTAYESYFVLQRSSDIYVLLPRLAPSLTEELAARLDAAFMSLRDLTPESIEDRFADDLLILTASSQLPFENLEQSANSIELLIADLSALFPTQVFIFGTSRELDEDHVDAIRTKVKSLTNVTHTYIVTPYSLKDELATYVRRFGISPLRTEEFRSVLLKQAPAEEYIVGRIATDSLLDTLNVHEVYVEPRCDAIFAGSEMSIPGRSIEKAFMATDRFLAADQSRILMVFGGYGVGKSAFCSNVLRRLNKEESKIVGIYIALRNVNTPSHISKIVQNARTLAALRGPKNARVCVLLDGLDELSGAMAPDSRRQNMIHILEASRHADKVIVAVRTSYFRGLADFWDLFARDEDHPFKHKLFQHILPGGWRPAIEAIVLEEFRNNDIDEYVRQFGQARGKDESYYLRFQESLKRHDPRDVYRRLARSPLYLSLLANTEPWNDPTVQSIGSVLNMLIDFWLQRDVEKGSSRWLLTAFDRRAFVYRLSWWMHEKNLSSLSFEEFDEFVSEYLGNSSVDASLTLDLQTTGFLTTDGSQFYFVLPGFMDYLVAERFALGDFDQPPTRLPTGNQARIWLGLLETDASNEAAWRNQVSDQWLSSLGIRYGQHAEPINVPAEGIVYGDASGSTGWPRANDQLNIKQRVAINAAFAPRSGPDERILRIRIANKMGLHMKPSSILVRVCTDWLKSFVENTKPTIEFRFEGRTAGPKSMMEVLQLGIPGSETMELVYDGCLDEDIYRLLDNLDGVRSSGEASHDWNIFASGRIDDPF